MQMTYRPNKFQVQQTLALLHATVTNLERTVKPTKTEAAKFRNEDRREGTVTCTSLERLLAMWIGFRT